MLSLFVDCTAQPSDSDTVTLAYFPKISFSKGWFMLHFLWQGLKLGLLNEVPNTILLQMLLR